MNMDIRLQLSFRNHPKTKKLKFELGAEGVLSFIWLLMFAAESKSEGLFDGMDEIDIALAADWVGEPDVFVSFLVGVRLLDFDGETYSIHDWEQHNPWAANAEKRSAHARKAAQAKWGVKYGKCDSETENQRVNEKINAPSIDEQCTEHEGAMLGASMGNAPTPTPTPIPKPELIDLSKPTVSPCPHEEIIAAYHKALPELQRVLVARWPGSAGEKNLRTRWRENAEHRSVDWWHEFFAIVRTNPHWMGQNKRGWRADLRWLIERRNFDKVVERWANAA